MTTGWFYVCAGEELVEHALQAGGREFKSLRPTSKVPFQRLSFSEAIRRV